MVVPSQRLLLISFLLVLVSTTLVHAKGKKQPAEDIGGAGEDNGTGEDAVEDTVDDGVEAAGKGGKKNLDSGPVTYDARSLMINGKRELLFSGSIHYPRSPVEVSF